MFHPALKKSLTVALLAGASWLAHGSAHAGELTLFADSGFSGREVAVAGPVSDLTRAGFNDRASSVVVRSGRWQLCEHANFEGQCVILDRGEYPDLRRLGDRVSSLREVDSRGAGDDDAGWDGRHDERRGEYSDHRERGRADRYEFEGRSERDYRDYRDYGDYQGARARGPAVEMFRRPDLRGNRRELNDNVLRDFNAIGFNDRPQSLLIRYGEWEFCEHANFRGYCEVYGPGRHADLGYMNRQFSSARRVR